MNHEHVDALFQDQLLNDHRTLSEYCCLQLWPQALIRLGLFPAEALNCNSDRRLPLHIACNQDAPPVFIYALASSYPSALNVQDEDGMTPIHCACSFREAKVETLEALIAWSVSHGHDDMMVQDEDGDTPLQSACRAAANYLVLKRLIDINPAALNVRDKEQLTPLLRIWVRALVLYKEEELDGYRKKSDLNGDLADIWHKTELLLKAMAFGKTELPEGVVFSILQSMVSFDCPRVALRMGMRFFKDEFYKKEMFSGCLLWCAISAPLYRARDLSDEGYFYRADESSDGKGLVDNNEDDFNLVYRRDGSHVMVPSVIDILLKSEPGLIQACYRDGMLPLNLALFAGKGWTDGVKAIVELCPAAVNQPDANTGLLPFMIAAFSCQWNGAKLNTAFELLRRSPDVLLHMVENCRKDKQLEQSSGKKRDRNYLDANCNDSTLNSSYDVTCKREKVLSTYESVDTLNPWLDDKQDIDEYGSDQPTNPWLDD